jgi:hypothetical protein
MGLWGNAVSTHSWKASFGFLYGLANAHKAYPDSIKTFTVEKIVIY